MNESMLDLNVVCLVCLCPQQDFCSIFSNDRDLPEMQILDKITSCSNMRLPEKLLQKVPHKICSVCLGELSITWRFRKKCEAANKIFQGMHRQDLEAEELAKVTLEEHKLKLPAGLKVKCVNSLQLRLKIPNDVDLSASPIGTIKLEHDFDAEQSLALSTEPGDMEFVRDCMNLNGTDAAEESVVDQVEYVYSDNYFEDSKSDFKSNKEEPTSYMHDADEKSRESIILLASVHVKPKPKRKSIQKHEQARLETTRRIHDAMPKTKKAVGPQNQTTVSKANAISTKNRASEQPKSATCLKEETDSDCDQPTLTSTSTPTQRCKQSAASTRPSKICDICGNTYKYQHALNAHMRRHNNERPYPCEVCNKAFVSNVELRRHMRMHTGQKPYGCKFCDRRFSDFGSSKKHERIHTGERPYVCEVCNKGFAYAHVLTVHRRTHTGEKKFPCPHCEKGFTKKVYLLSHVEQHKLAKRLPYLVKDDDLTNCGNSNSNSNNNNYNDINIGASILLQSSDDVNADTFTSGVYDDDKVLEECIVSSDDFIGDATTQNDHDHHHVDDVTQVYPVVLSTDFMDSDQLEEHKYIMP